MQIEIIQPDALLQPTTTQEQLIAEIRQRILRRVYSPGQRLIERELAEEFQVSRSVVRDALSVLAERRLILRPQNRGAEVARLERADIVSIFQVREVTEGLLVRLATQLAPPGAWDALIELFNGPAVEAVTAHEVDKYAAMLDLLSEQTIRFAANSVLSEIHSSLVDRIAVLSYRVLYLPQRIEKGLLGHQKILRAMAEGRAEDAERLKRENIQAACESLLAFENFIL